MIPKIIHYCWFGGKEKPQSVLEYIKTWKEQLPDFEIKEWNESNFDVNMMPYTREAYYAKKYAFVSDVARLYALNNEGGIYLDTDIKFIKPLNDDILKNKAVFAIENEIYLATSFIASEVGGSLVKHLLEQYDNIHFFYSLRYDLTPNVARFTKLLRKEGICLKNNFVKTDEFIIYPQDYFSAKCYETGEYQITSNTYCIHDFSSLWTDDSTSYFDKLRNLSNMVLTIIKYKNNTYATFIKDS